jgi:lipopolysaccharide export system protein LptA
MKKIIEHLINQIVDLKIKQIELENKYRKVSNEKVAADNIIFNLKNEITNLRITLSLAIDEQKVTKEDLKNDIDVFITDADKQ